MLKAEYHGAVGYSQRASAEHEEYEKALSAIIRKGEERGGVDLMELIVSRRNLNEAFKRVKANKGAPGIDGMTVDEASDWIRENKVDLIQSIVGGRYKPQPVRRKEIPKPDGGVRKLGIPTVVDRIIQQAVAQVLVPIFDPTFSEFSYGYRPGKQAHQAIRQVRDYANEGYTQVASLDLSKYFDTINHNLLIATLRERIKDDRVIKLIKKFLKAGVMENGIKRPTEEGSPQGGPLSPLLANIYLDKFDKTMESRGVKFVRYADDINLLARSKRAAQRQMDHAKSFLEGKLKLRLNTEKSRVVSVYSTKNFKFLGFAIGKNENGAYIRAHPKSLKKAKAKFKEFTRRNAGQNVESIMLKEEQYAKGWLGYYRLARIKSRLTAWDSWRRRRYRAYIWKQWKTIGNRIRNLRKLGIKEQSAIQLSMSRKSYWRISRTPALNKALSNERLKQMGFFSLAEFYEKNRLCG